MYFLGNMNGEDQNFLIFDLGMVVNSFGVNFVGKMFIVYNVVVGMEGFLNFVNQFVVGVNISVNDISVGCVIGICNLFFIVLVEEILDFFYGFLIILDLIRIYYFVFGRLFGDVMVILFISGEVYSVIEQLNNKFVGKCKV